MRPLEKRAWSVLDKDVDDGYAIAESQSPSPAGALDLMQELIQRHNQRYAHILFRLALVHPAVKVHNQRNE
jgi:hypothetical protein